MYRKPSWSRSRSYTSEMAADTETMLWPLTSRKKAWLELSWRRLLIILISSLMLTWSGTRNLVLSRMGSCFSPAYLSMITGILLGCCSRISLTSSTLCSNVLLCLKVFSEGILRQSQSQLAVEKTEVATVLNTK